ncbi:MULTISPECIES: SpoIIIAH-like family protein [Bacillus]|uniref:SpoIIIAH-like family protein n=1 Tax=Bacillus salipaludis TaxID=2547811 RepID=A0A4R5VP09_9BACI|nr:MULTISPECIES: SpoIIIAH-like family protein [Bacillus]MDQ6599595.1 SpoIIIAH-like family protein [Bacillus salipaludis]TDK60138.1 SpoIIIAH-like family protein [Bacillus salipaludis]
MLLKKQTVWLLTMLSLVVVLSVYYITSPEQKNSNELAAVQQKAKDQMNQKEMNSKSTAKTNAKDDKTIISQIAGDDEFEALRLKLQDERSQLQEDLTAQMASTDLPADKRSEAMDQMKELNKTAQKEEILETLIKTMGYEDALVRAEGNQVRVTVKSKKQPSATAANDIIQQVKKEIGDTNYVAVEFQPTK